MGERGARADVQLGESDRHAMLSHFDLWSYDDVTEHADAILASVEAAKCL